KPSARRTRSQSSSNSLLETSFISGRPLSCAHSRRTPWSFFTLPCSSPEKRFVLMLQSRITPSSCEDEVRRIIGQFGQESDGRSFGGAGRSSNWWTERAPWRFEVPRQSGPV